MELTLEVSCDKWPQYVEKDYRQYFDENLESILSFSEFGTSMIYPWINLRLLILSSERSARSHFGY